MTLSKEDFRFWDVRTIGRRIRKGLLTKKDVEKHQKGLDDSKDRIAPPETDDGEDAEA